MTSGRATVSTRVGGVPEAVADTGVVVPPRDPEAMAAACLQLLGDDVRRHRLAAAARRRALELFTVDRAVGSFRVIYADLAAGAAGLTTRSGGPPPLPALPPAQVPAQTAARAGMPA